MKTTAHLLIGMMLGTAAAGLLFFTPAKVVSAQDPTKLAPQEYKVLFENCQFRVIEYRLKPGGKEPMHSHPYGVFAYFLSDAKMRTTFPDGKTTEDLQRAGDWVWRDPVTHFGENIGTTDAHALLIEPEHACK